MGRRVLHLLAGLLLASLAPTAHASAGAGRVRDYEVVQMDCTERATGQTVHAMRSLVFDGEPRLLVADVDTLATRLVAPDQLDCEGPAAEEAFERSRFGRALFAATEAPFPTHNDGVQRATEPVQGLFVTVDLCPAPRQKFAPKLFDSLASVSSETGSPVPVAIAVSADWLTRHEAQFSALVEMERSGKLAITWVNHSKSHPFDAAAPIEQTFLLTAGMDADSEVTATEIALLERGMVPSVFFRFPGLVSDERWMQRLASYSLIPLGSDAWLAYGQRPTPGSVILVHGNGNEPAGVSAFLRQLLSMRAIGPFLPLTQLFGATP